MCSSSHKYTYQPRNSRNSQPVKQTCGNWGGLVESFAAINFAEGLWQILQELQINLLPKGLIGGLMRSSSPTRGSGHRPNLFTILKDLFVGKAKFNSNIFIDEAFVEIPEYILIYLLSSALAASWFGRSITRSLNIPHFELLGRPIAELSKFKGQNIAIGSRKSKNVFLDENLLNRVALGKLGLFVGLASFCSALEFAVPSIRVLLSKFFLGVDDFYELSGLNKVANHSGESSNRIEKARRSVWLGLGMALASVAPVLGLTNYMRGKIGNPKVAKIVRRGSMIFDMSDRFGLSRIFAATVLLLGAPAGYLNAARNDAEKTEIWRRALLFALPSVIFYKQAAGNLLAAATGLVGGVGNVLMPLSAYSREVAQGRRDPLNLDLVKLSRNKKTGFFEGHITKLPSIRKLSNSKRLSMLKAIHFMEHAAPYWMALSVGLTINWFNYLHTYDCFEHDRSSRQDLADAPS